MRTNPEMPPALSPPTDRREVFARTYVQDLNASHAYRVAFPDEDRSDQATWNGASKVMAEPAVRARIEELLRERYATIDLKTEQIVRQLVNIGFFDIRGLFNDDGTGKLPHELPEYAARALDSVKIEEHYRIERTSEIDNDTGEVKERVEPVRVVVKEYKVAPRLTALNTLAKHQGMLDERVKLTFEDGATDAMDEATLAARVAALIEAARLRRLALKDGEDLL